MIKKKLPKIYLTLVFVFLYAPILVLFVESFNASEIRGSWGGFTLDWYRELFSDPDLLRSVGITFLVAIITTVVSTIVGTLAAVGILAYKRNFRTVILNVNNLPVLNPDIVTAISLMILFVVLRAEFGLITLTLSHIVFSIPYVILSVLPKLRQMNKHLAEAAMDLGASPIQAFIKVILPEIRPGIFTGALLAFTLSIDDFVISFFTTGHGISNISTMVYSMARRGISPVINAMSTILFIIMLIILVILNKNTEGNEDGIFL